MSIISFKSFITSNDLYDEFMEEVLGDINYQELLFENTSLLVEKSVVDPEGSNKTADNDTSGKLHEILFAAHMHDGVDEKGNITKHPEDTRAKGKKSEDIHRALTKKVGGVNSEEYQKINKAAKSLAAHWKKQHLPPGHTVTTAHWSSQAGDHRKITGIEDKESKADVIIQSKDKQGNIHHHPISLKYTKSDPNLANNGLERISSEAGVSQGGLSAEWKEHMDRTSALHAGDSIHHKSGQYKVDALVRDAVAKGKDARTAVQASHDALIKKQKSEGELNPKYAARLETHKKWLEAHDKEEDKEAFVNASADRANQADESKTKALASIAAKTANSYNMKGDAHIRGSLVKLATPHTVIPHTVAVSYTKDDGTSTPFSTTEHNFAHDHLKQFENIRAVHSGNGVVFYGRRSGINPKTGKAHDSDTRIGTLNFKGGNGPYEGANSTLVMHGIMRDTMERQSKGKVTTSSKETSEPKVAPTPARQEPESTQTKEVKRPSLSSAAAKVMSKPKTAPVQSKPTPTAAPTPKPQPTTQPKAPKKPESAYDYKGARSQDLGRKIKSGDTEAEKELKRRELRK